MAVQADKTVHFGWFVRHARAGKYSLGEFAQALDLTPRRVSQIEVSMREPAIYPDTMSAIARLLGYADVATFEEAWRSTPVERPKFKPAPVGGSVLLRVRVPKAVAEALRAMGSAEAVAARLLAEAVSQPARGGAGASSEQAQSVPLTVKHLEDQPARVMEVDPGKVVIEEQIEDREVPPKTGQTKTHRNAGSVN